MKDGLNQLYYLRHVRWCQRRDSTRRLERVLPPTRRNCRVESRRRCELCLINLRRSRQVTGISSSAQWVTRRTRRMNWVQVLITADSSTTATYTVALWSPRRSLKSFVFHSSDLKSNTSAPRRGATLTFLGGPIAPCIDCRHTQVVSYSQGRPKATPATQNASQKSSGRGQNEAVGGQCLNLVSLFSGKWLKLLKADVIF